jgi:type VI protein secretion system component VasK
MAGNLEGRKVGGSGGRPRGEFLNRLGYYGVGVAIGFILLGLIWQSRANRQRAMLEERERQRLQEQAPGTGHPASGKAGEGAGQPGSGTP